MFSIVVDHGVSRLSLAPVLGMREARPLQDALEEPLAKGLPLTLHAQPVERLSTASAQILVAGAAALEQGGHGAVASLARNRGVLTRAGPRPGHQEVQRGEVR